MPDLATIASAVNGLKNAIDIATFFKNTDISFQKAEHKVKVADLISTLADVKMQLAEVQQTILDKDAEIKSLKVDLEVKGQRVYEPPYYWVEKNGKKDGPYCQQCQDSNSKLIRLQSYGDGCWTCKTCQNSFQDLTYRPAKSRVVDTDYDIFG